VDRKKLGIRLRRATTKFYAAVTPLHSQRSGSSMRRAMRQLVMM